jgi:hypothetical protein
MIVSRVSEYFWNIVLQRSVPLERTGFTLPFTLAACRRGAPASALDGCESEGQRFEFGKTIHRLPAPTAGLVSWSATRLFLSQCALQHGVWLPPRCGGLRGVHVLQRFQNGVRPSHGCRLHDASPPLDGVSRRAHDVQLPSCGVRHPDGLPCSILLLNWDCLFGPSIIPFIAFVCRGYYHLFVPPIKTGSEGVIYSACLP